jgi:hypothetical protein
VFRVFASTFNRIRRLGATSVENRQVARTLCSRCS